MAVSNMMIKLSAQNVVPLICAILPQPSEVISLFLQVTFIDVDYSSSSLDMQVVWKGNLNSSKYRL